MHLLSSNRIIILQVDTARRYQLMGHFLVFSRNLRLYPQPVRVMRPRRRTMVICEQGKTLCTVDEFVMMILRLVLPFLHALYLLLKQIASLRAAAFLRIKRFVHLRVGGLIRRRVCH